MKPRPSKTTPKHSSNKRANVDERYTFNQGGWHKAWQEFEAEYKISQNYQPHEQIIFMAFEAGFNAQPTQPTQPTPELENILAKFKRGDVLDRFVFEELVDEAKQALAHYCQKREIEARKDENSRWLEMTDENSFCIGAENFEQRIAQLSTKEEV